MNLTELESVLRELQPSLIGGWVQKIHQPFPNTLTLDIRVPGETLVLFLCADPPFARFHFTSRKLLNPPAPPPFCQYLRAHLEGGRIEGVAQEPGDRVVYVTVATGAGQFILVVALTGNQSNVYLLNESKEVLQALKPSRLKTGDRYSPPTPPSPRKGEGKEPKDSGTPLSHPSSQPPPRKREGSRERDPSVEFSFRFPVSAEIDARYSQQEHDRSLSQLREGQLARVKKALKQATKKITGLEEDLKKAEKYREYGRYGELLKGQLHSLAKGQASVTVVDYYDPSLPQLTLPLDASKDPVWNMEDYFRKHHKFLSAQTHLQPRLELAKQEARHLQEALTKNESGEEFLTERIGARVQEKRTGRHLASAERPKTQTARATPYRQFVSADGVLLLVGKTAKDNDTLTFKVAGPEDLWLHARGTPGSHVIVRLEKGAEVPHETLKDAATLALWFSDLRKSGKGEVIYSRRKFVKKAKGQKSGAVTVTREKSVWIEVRKERLNRLKGKDS